MDEEKMLSVRQTKIGLKNLYLMTIITIGLIGLGVGSTFAMFTASTNIDNPIALASNLSSTNILAETVEVIIPAGEDREVDLAISNTSQDALHYTAWYMPSSNDLEVGSVSSNNSYGPVGLIPSAGSFTLTVQLRNNGDSPITVTLGVSSSTSDIVLASGMTQVPARVLPMLSDYTYILGSDQTTISTFSADFYNSSSQTISEQSNVTLPASISIAQNEILLVRYIGSDTEVNVPNTITVNGNTYNVVLLSYVTDGNNLSTGVFYHNDDIEEVSFGNNVKYIALNSSGNGYDNYSMSNMFNSCTSLSSIDLSNIDLDDVTVYTNTLNGVSTTTTITVPDCIQYRSFTSKFGYNYTGLSAITSDYTCYYQEVEYIQSSGTQYIDTSVSSSNDIYAEIDVEYTATSSSSQLLFSSGTSAGQWTGQHGGNYSVGITSDLKLSISSTSRKVLNITFNSSGVTLSIDGSSVSRSGSHNTGDNYFIFASPVSSFYSQVKLYSAQIYDSNNALIRGFVPCYSVTTVTNSKGVQVPSETAGLYDTVNDVFYTNANIAANAAAFTVGPDVNS